MRALGRDQENDLIVLNLHNEKPLSILGDYLLVSCKNTTDPVDAQIVRKFRSRLGETKCQCGIIVAKAGITGEKARGAARAADRALVKADQPILVLNHNDLEALSKGRDELSNQPVEKYAIRVFDLFD